MVNRLRRHAPRVAAWVAWIASGLAIGYAASQCELPAPEPDPAPDCRGHMILLAEAISRQRNEAQAMVFAFSCVYPDQPQIPIPTPTREGTIRS